MVITPAPISRVPVPVLLSCALNTPSNATSTKAMSSQSQNSFPLKDPKSLLVLMPKDTIDVEEESRLYDELCDVSSFVGIHRWVVYRSKDEDARYIRPKSTVPQSPTLAPSVFSHDIWLGDNSGESLAFARQVEIRGWTNVGDKLGGAYIGKSD